MRTTSCVTLLSVCACARVCAYARVCARARVHVCVQSPPPALSAPLNVSVFVCCALAVIRDGSHSAVKRHRIKLEKDKKHKLWVAAQVSLSLPPSLPPSLWCALSLSQHAVVGPAAAHRDRQRGGRLRGGDRPGERTVRCGREEDERGAGSFSLSLSRARSVSLSLSRSCVCFADASSRVPVPSPQLVSLQEQLEQATREAGLPPDDPVNMDPLGAAHSLLLPTHLTTHI